MKNTTLGLAVFACIILTNGYSQSTFQKLIKGNGRTHLNSVSKAADGYIHVGQILDNSNIVVTKFDENTNIDWMHFFTDSLHTNFGFANIVQVADGGYIISTASQFLVFKLNRVGNIAWSEKISFTAASGYVLYSPSDMIVTKDGNVVITGSMAEQSSPRVYIAYVLKINYTDGSIMWIKRLRLKKSVGFGMESFEINQNNDESYILCGTFSRTNQLKHPYSYQPYPLLVSLNKNGEAQWAKIYEEATYSKLYIVSEALDGGYIAVGRQTLDGGNHYVYMPVIKFDHVGNIEWAKRVTKLQVTDKRKTYLNGNDIVVNYDTSYTIVGGNSYGGGGYTIGFAINLNKTGDHIWSKTLGGLKYKPVLFRNIIKTKDSGFIASGDYSTSRQKTYLVLSKFDKNGNSCSDSIPVTIIGDYSYTPVDSPMISQDLTSFITTAEYSLNRDTGHKYISTLCSSDLVNFISRSDSQIIEKINSNVSVKIFPNPVVSNRLNLTIHYTKTNNIQLTILNMEGKSVFSEKLLVIPGILSKTINVSSLIKGVYILKVADGREQQAVKFVKQH